MQKILPISGDLGRYRAILLILTIAAVLVGACGAPQPKVYRVGVLSGLTFFSNITDGFKAGMAELGYVEGENITYDVQSSDVDPEAYKRILRQFVADKVDLILVYPTEAALDAKAITAGTNIPVVFVYSMIEGMGLVESVAAPGGNITGVRLPGADVALKRLEILREIAPDAERILVPYQRGYPIVQSQLDVVRPAAAAAGVTLMELPAASVAELEAELQRRTESGDRGVDAVLFLVEPLVLAPGAFSAIGKFADPANLPIGGIPMSADGYDTIFGVFVDPVKSGKQAAPLADKVLHGMPAGEVPVVSSESFLQINYRKAHTLGLTVPEGLLNQAEEIVR